MRRESNSTTDFCNRKSVEVISFFQLVLSANSVAIGSSSESENFHFNPRNRISIQISVICEISGRQAQNSKRKAHLYPYNCLGIQIGVIREISVKPLLKAPQEIRSHFWKQ